MSLFERRLTLPACPRLSSDGRYLEWKGYGNDGDLRDAGPAPRLLGKFCHLQSETSNIADFASRYGVLGICEHGEFPVWGGGHEQCRQRSGFETDGRGRVTQTNLLWNREPLSTWRSLSNLAATLGSSVTRLQGQGSLDASAVRLFRRRWPHLPSNAHEMYAEVFTRLAIDARLEPRVRVTAGRPRVTLQPPKPSDFAPGNVLALVVSELIDQAGTEQFACSICDEPLVQGDGRYKPRTDRRILCSEECKSEAKRRRSRESDRRKRQGQRQPAQ